MGQMTGSEAGTLDVHDPDLAGPPPWLVIDSEPPPSDVIPPDPLGDHPFENDPDATRSVQSAGAAGRPPGEWLPAVEPGPGLVGELEAIDARSVGLYDLVELMAAYQRVESWAHSRVTEMAGALARRPGINPHHPLPGGKIAADVAAAEIAPRLGISRYSARRIVTEAELFRNKLDDTAEALRRGHIDPAKASALARQLEDLPADVAWEVQREVLAEAPHMTPSQLSRATAKAIIAFDPHRATQRHRRARENRRVDHPRVLPDGMASIHAVLPATDAAGLDLALEAAARSAKSNGDTRTVDQLRADALALMGHAALDDGFIGSRGWASAAGDEADTAHETDTDELQPVSDYLRMVRMPVGTIGGRRAHIRVTVPLSALVLPPETQGASSYGECLDHLTGRAPDIDEGDSPAHRGAELRPESDDGDGPILAEVAELEGYGPIAPDVARALAMSAGTWQRLVTDPLSGQVLDVGTTRYRPPAALAEFVRARDRLCVFPGCTTPAHSCALDHVVRYPDGPTAAFNLAPLCTPHHAPKTLGAFQLRRLEDGTFEWTTPSGHVYRRDSRGRITWVRSPSALDLDAEPPF